MVVGLRIGIVSKWFPSGQGVVSRHLRSALDQLGHETFILARPGRGPRAARQKSGSERRDPVWEASGVSQASAHGISAGEYLDWAAELGLDLVFCDENYQFDHLAGLRAAGILTVGRFVWESFAPADVDGARRAYDVIYSLTRCEQQRYEELGIESPYLRWGIHPELLGAGDPRPEDGLVRYFFACSFLGPRRPMREVLKAFRRVGGDHLRLRVSAQLPRRAEQLQRAAARDPRIELLLEELPTAEYLAAFAASDVCLAPSRWEGLGVPLFEATALGLPIITNDAPPMNEIVTDGRNGLLVESRPSGTAKSGIDSHDPDVDSLAAAIERIADPEQRASLAAGSRAVREERSWDRTVADFERLLEGLASGSVLRE